MSLKLKLLVVSLLLSINVKCSFCEGICQLAMYQADEGPRSAGSNVTVVSEIFCSDSKNILRITLQTSMDEETSSRPTAAYSYASWKRQDTSVVLEYNPIEHLNIRIGEIANNTRKYFWIFDYLPENYDELELTTKASVPGISSATNLRLTVLPCASPKYLNATRQDSSFAITARTSTNYNSLGDCRCLNNGEVLYHENGAIANGEATCGLYAAWTGCENVQCWSGPRGIKAVQEKFTAGDSNPFKCSFTGGFPVPKIYRYTLGNKEIPLEGYVLKSGDNDKKLLCELSSRFPPASPDEYKSSLQTVIVFYPPESSSLSSNALAIRINESGVLNYSFSANPAQGRVLTTIRNQLLTDFHSLFTFYMYTEELHYVYEIKVFVTSHQDYGEYEICASTEKPVGKQCINLTIRNPEIHADTLSPIIIGLVVAGAFILIILIVALVICCNRRKQTTAQGIGRDVRMNQLYGSAPNQASSAPSPARVIEARANAVYGSRGSEPDAVVYAMARDPEEEETVDSNLPASQERCPSSMSIYSEVDLKNRRVNLIFSGESEDTDQPDSSAVVYAVVGPNTE